MVWQVTTDDVTEGTDRSSLMPWPEHKKRNAAIVKSNELATQT